MPVSERDTVLKCGKRDTVLRHRCASGDSGTGVRVLPLPSPSARARQNERLRASPVAGAGARMGPECGCSAWHRLGLHRRRGHSHVPRPAFQRCLPTRSLLPERFRGGVAPSAPGPRCVTRSLPRRFSDYSFSLTRAQPTPVPAANDVTPNSHESHLCHTNRGWRNSRLHKRTQAVPPQKRSTRKTSAQNDQSRKHDKNPKRALFSREDTRLQARVTQRCGRDGVRTARPSHAG